MPTPGRVWVFRRLLARWAANTRLGMLTSVLAIATTAATVMLVSGTRPTPAEAYSLQINRDGTITVTLNGRIRPAAERDA